MANLFRCGGGRSEASYQNLMDQLVEETVTGPVASFADGANNIPAKEIICHINPTETGTGEKSPQNPYVIGGFTECNTTRTGKNLFDKNTVTYGQFANSSGTINPNSAGCMSDYIEVLPNQPVYVRVLGNSTVGFYSFSICKYDENKNFISRSHQYPADATNHQYDIPSNCKYIIFQIALSAGNTITSQNVDDGQIIVSLTTLINTNTYETYTLPTVYNVPFGQTVYGGTLNVTTGVLTVEWVQTTLSDCEISYFAPSSSYPLGFFYCKANPNKKVGARNIISSIFLTTGGGWSNDNRIFGNASIPNFYIVCSTCSSAADLKQTYGSSQIVYELETPQTIQLTPTEIKTLLGANNFYHDCNGDIDVTYRANGALYVQEHPITRGLMASRPTEQIQEQEEQQEEKEINKSEDNEK